MFAISMKPRQQVGNFVNDITVHFTTDPVEVLKRDILTLIAGLVILCL